MGVLGQNLLSSLTGNIPKAVLCVRQMSSQNASSIQETLKKGEELQKKLLQETGNALNGLPRDSSKAGLTYNSQTQAGGIMANSGYLALEVQYNPNSIALDIHADQPARKSGGDLGSKGVNQVVQACQPMAATMKLQLIFDDMNPQDAFMMSNMASSVGNAVSGVSGLAKKANGNGYSVQAQIEGLMAALTRPETRQVIFFWSKMCFRGEICSVNARYTMFNKSGSPIRGTVDLVIRQAGGGAMEEMYWDEAFTFAFGSADQSMEIY